MTEIQLQAECFQWAWMEFPETRRLLWAVPNGGHRNGLEAEQLKASGVIAGVHDLHFLWRGRFWTFELKVGQNKMTVDHVNKKGKKVFGQVEWATRISQQGAKWFEIRDFETFKKVFTEIVRS